MLKKFINSTNDKGDGKMNSKNSILRLGIAALMLCLLAATFITGCGGANSSGGESNPTQNSSGTLPSSYNVRGTLISDSTNLTPAAGITIKLFIQDPVTSNFIDTGKSAVTLSSGEFSFIGLTRGVYVLSASGSATLQNSQKLLVINESNTDSNIETGNMMITPIGSTPTGEVTLRGKTVADGPGAAPIGGLTIRLSRLGADGSWALLADKVTQSLSSGEFVFLKLETGTYKLDIDGLINGISKFTPSSKLAIIGTTANLTELDVGNIIMVPVPSPSTAIPTIALKGRLIDALASSPMSVAIISLDSGQTTVTDGLGFFEIKGVETGIRRLNISKQGMASFTLSFEVISNGVAVTGVSLNSQFYAVNGADGRTVDLFAHGYDIKITLDQHSSGSLMGTVKKFVFDTDGKATYATIPEENYSFELWQVYPDNSSVRHGAVTSDDDGEWKIDNLPPYEDNSALWFAVPPGTIVAVSQGQTGNIVTFTNSSSEWSGYNPVLAYGYKIESGKTTIMDFTLPTFITQPAPKVQRIVDARLATDPAAIYPGEYDLDSNVNSLENVYLKWTGPNLVNQIVLSFQKAYRNTTAIETYKTLPSTPGQISSATFQPGIIGLGFGRYTWKVTVYDPATKIPLDSSPHLFIVSPSDSDLTPSGGTTISLAAVAYKITFMAPKDDEATSVSMELYQILAGGAQVLIGTPAKDTITTSPIWTLTLPASTNAGNYKWRAVYQYSKGQPMYSDFANLTFNN